MFIKLSINCNKSSIESITQKNWGKIANGHNDSKLISFK